MALSHQPCLVTLETLQAFCEQTKCLPRGFLDGVEANSNTQDIHQLRLAGWEDDIWVLLLAALSLSEDAAQLLDTEPAYTRLSNTEIDDLAKYVKTKAFIQSERSCSC